MAAACLLVACVSPPSSLDWARVRVDPISVNDPIKLESDITQCAMLADQARVVARAQDEADASAAALGGAAAGAAVGAALGSMYGAPGQGAAWGAAAGASRGDDVPRSEEDVRQSAIGSCLGNRGYALLW